MHAGHYISGAGHLALIGWLLFGGIFRPEPMPFEMTEVSVISGAEFDALIAAQQAPEQVTEVAQPTAPATQATEQPEVPEPADTAIEQPEPVQTETPPADPTPQVAEQIPPPQADISDQPPDAPEPPGDVAVLVPEVAPTAVPRPAPRVAPEPVAQPEPEARPDPVETPAVTPEPSETPTPAEPQTAAAPEEATSEIVTEATQAPKASPRPPGRRPAAPVAVAEKPAETPAEPAAAEPATEPAETAAAKPADTPAVDTDAVADALAEALAGTPTPAAQSSGPPLSAGEKEALRVAVSSCWNVGSLSSEALQTTVVVTVSMNQDGTPITGSIQLASSSGGSDGAARQAFEAARRAIIRCGAKGYQLPLEKFGQWQNIEMTFNPERMRIK